MEATPRPWIVDECADYRGFETIRVADGTPNGNTGMQPIATVYNEANAALIVKAVNAHEKLVAAFTAAVERMEAVAAGIHVEKRAEGISQAMHVRHMAGHLEQHAKIARSALAECA